MGAMELEEKTVQIRDDFDPDKILESGQCFRPRKQAEGWYTATGKQVSREAHRRRTGKTNKLALRQIEGQLCLDFGKVFWYWYIRCV